MTIENLRIFSGKCEWKSYPSKFTRLEFILYNHDYGSIVLANQIVNCDQKRSNKSSNK